MLISLCFARQKEDDIYQNLPLSGSLNKILDLFTKPVLHSDMGKFKSHTLCIEILSLASSVIFKLFKLLSLSFLTWKMVIRVLIRHRVIVSIEYDNLCKIFSTSLSQLDSINIS